MKVNSCCYMVIITLSL